MYCMYSIVQYVHVHECAVSPCQTIPSQTVSYPWLFLTLVYEITLYLHPAVCIYVHMYYVCLYVCPSEYLHSMFSIY
jgi:hypothetical protein